MLLLLRIRITYSLDLRDILWQEQACSVSVHEAECDVLTFYALLRLCICVRRNFMEARI